MCIQSSKRWLKRALKLEHVWVFDTMSRHGCRTPSSAQMRRAILTAPAERDDMLLLLLLLLLAQRELDAAAFAWTDAGGATDAAAAASAGMGARGSAGGGRPAAARFTSAPAACMRVLSTSSG